mmetsp:Transcript_15539/g.39075  ORF Transcript_15539/g.39075 Transcript_15539/m.39075 type:complete len:342 (+) Transcript_15539:774-1799(+)
MLRLEPIEQVIMPVLGSLWPRHSLRLSHLLNLLISTRLPQSARFPLGETHLVPLQPPILCHYGIRKVRNLLLGQVIDARGDLVRAVSPDLWSLESPEATRKHDRRRLLPPIIAPQIRCHLVRYRRLEVKCGDDAVLSRDFPHSRLLLCCRNCRRHAWAAAVPDHLTDAWHTVGLRCRCPSPHTGWHRDIWPLWPRGSARARPPDRLRNKYSTPPPPSGLVGCRRGPPCWPNHIMSCGSVSLLPKVYKPSPRILTALLGLRHCGMSNFEHRSCHIAICQLFTRRSGIHSHFGHHCCASCASFDRWRAAVCPSTLGVGLSLAPRIARSAPRGVGPNGGRHFRG